MRELDNGVADAMRTSSQTEVEECELVYSDKSVFADEYTDEAFCDEFGEMVAEAEPSDQASESDDMDGYMEDPDSLWGRIERQMGAKEYQVWLAEHLTQRKEKPSSGLIITHLLGFDENNQPILETFRSSETAEQAPVEQTEQVTEPASEFGHSNPNHLEEPPHRENSEAEQPKVKQINIHIDLDLYKLLVPAAAIAGVAILALGYRKQDKLIGGLKAIKNQLKSIKKD